MMDMLSETQWVALIGLGGGILLGLAARLGRFCTLGAIEDVLYGGSDVRLRLWGVAIGVAIMGSFGLISVGALDARQSYYLSVPWMPMASILGGLTFGYGMALAGNCGFGAIARLGGGDLRSFVIVLVMGVSAYGVLNGPLAPLRTWLFPQGTLIGDIPPEAPLSGALLYMQELLGEAGMARLNAELG
ncbi:MAG: YeeE/YedE thiosulfate transporter family protein, partial [Paracoccaceae bacterium]